jgi:hypothetical protein
LGSDDDAGLERRYFEIPRVKLLTKAGMMRKPGLLFDRKSALVRMVLTVDFSFFWGVTLDLSLK